MCASRKLLQCMTVVLIYQVAHTSAVPSLRQRRDASSANSTIKIRPSDDFTTEFAKQVIRIAKAADMKAYMDDKVDPCNDFYKFSCGNWHRIHPAQILNNIMTDTFQNLKTAFDRKLKQLLREPRTDNKIENQVKDFYEACQALSTDNASQRAKYILELRSVYDEFGGMPVMTENWKAEEFVWWQTIAQIGHKYGKEIILSATIMGDIENKTENRIYLGTPDDDANNVNSKIINVLQLSKTVMDLESYLGLDINAAKKLASEMVEFERELVYGSSSGHAGLSLKDLITSTNVTELQAESGEVIDVRKYLEIVVGGVASEQLYLYDKSYWKNMLLVMAKKPKHIVANYIMWQLLQEFLIEIDEEDACVEKTKKYFGKFIDNLVYNRYKTPTMEQDVYEVWREIKDTFRDQMEGDKYDWIQNATREYALRKLDAMELEINSYERENFTKEYEGLTINAQSYVENIKAVNTQRTARVLKQLNQSVIHLEDTEVFSFTPAYNILENNIKIPVALLQPLYFWDINYPKAIKYGTLGYLIAHEMVHGFDDDGRKHDVNGNTYEWWDAKSTYEFDSRRKCFQAQYHSYKYGGLNLPESVSQSENIADNAGVKLAYAAYLKWLNAQQDDDILAKELLSELNYTNKQLFFIAFAQVWCDDVQFLFKSSVAGSDSHAPGRYRVIGSLSNFQEFSWVFKCKPDAPMDPEFKCAIY